MNKYLRQLFTAVVALFVILGLSSTIIMAVRANALNNDPRNARSLYHQLGAYRGAILASDGTVMAKSEPVNDAFKYLRTYSNGPLYAPVTGFFSINQTADRGLEASRSMLLNGEADSLIWQRAKAMLTGATDQGASIETSIDPKLQQVAYDQLGTRDGASSTIIMAVRANALNNDPRNARSLYHQLGAYRGAILASDGTVMAKSEPVNDAFKYLRTYSNGPLYAPVTGFFSINQTADRGLEASRSMLLNGEADSLIWQRAKAMLTGATDQGASIETSIDPKLQQVAYDQLGTRDGAAVAIEVSTGRILAMVSTPSYDPNKLATHDTKAASQAYNELSAGQNSPLINRATSQLYPPGSTFKTIVASAALETGDYQTDTKIPAGSSYTLPGTATRLPNAEAQADGVNGQISLQEAVAWSSNTAFAQLGVKLGASKVSDMATKLGFGSTITIDGTESTGTPMTATASTFPSDPTDDKLALASIGQGDTTATPLQMAMVAQAIANNGKLMQPTLVDRVRAADLTVLSQTKPQTMANAFSEDSADKLTTMMESVVTEANPQLAIDGIKVAAKTGTAQIGTDNSAIDGWVIGFAPADDPQIAVAVLVHNTDVYGSLAAGPIMRAMMQEALQQ